MTRPSDLFSATPPSALKRTLEGSVSVSESQNTVSSDSSSRGDFSPSIFITVLILTIVLIVSVSLHLLLRFLNRHCKSRNDEDHHEDHQHIESINVSRRISNRRVLPEDTHNENQKLIDSLPLFSFDSITGLKSTTSPDCAVCLSKFEKHDQLRLLPICCHAFHSKCIDTWLLSNRTCPLCRSTVPFDESELYDQKLSSRSSAGNDSFRLEIGSVSRRRMNPADTNTDLQQRSYSMGLFEYLIEDESEVNIVSEPIHQRRYSESNSGLKNDDDDDIRSESVIERRQTVPPPPGDDIAAEIGGGSGRGWLRDYVDKLASSTSSSLSSRTLSFSFRGRNFTGSSRRSEGVSISGRRGDDIDVVVGGGGSFDLEAHKYGEEIGSFLRWLSGV